MDIRSLLERGQEAQNNAHAEAEKAKLGILRGGSAGCIGTDGEAYGECARVALLRLQGVDKEVEPNRHIMFDAGRTAEDSWAAKLADAGVVFRREEWVPITWAVPGHPGRVVTGRPDIVIGSEFYRDTTEEENNARIAAGGHPHSIAMTQDFRPEFGLELKGIYSASSAVRVECEGIPDPKHLAQAAFYSMALGIPWAVCYTNPSVWDVPYWAKEARAKGHKKLQPFYRIFYLEWSELGAKTPDAAVLYYKDERSDHWVPTVYTKEGIAAYYASILRMESDHRLVDRPNGGYATGHALPWSKCKYCPFSAACDMFDVDQSYDGWLENCKTT